MADQDQCGCYGLALGHLLLPSQFYLCTYKNLLSATISVTVIQLTGSLLRDPGPTLVATVDMMLTQFSCHVHQGAALPQRQRLIVRGHSANCIEGVKLRARRGEFVIIGGVADCRYDVVI